MHIRILGTAAAEGWPAIFCSCDTCKKAREIGGKNLRSRASIQINDTHRIDFGPDVWYHEGVLGADMSKLEHLFITHSHWDHLAHPHLHYLVPPFGHGRNCPLHVYGNEAAAKIVMENWERLGPEFIRVHTLEPFVSVQAGSITFTPLLASHMLNERALFYLFSSHDKTGLYACDTGYFPEETWEFLEGIHLDFVISECTSGPAGDGKYHLNFEALFQVKERLEKTGSYTGGPFVATHFSHNVGMMHEEISAVLEPRGILAAFDGMEIHV